MGGTVSYRPQVRREPPLRAHPDDHLLATNPIKSTFSTVKLRTKVTHGAGSPAAALAMVFKLVESVQDRRRAIRGARLVALARAGSKLENGTFIEREQATAA